MRDAFWSLAMGAAERALVPDAAIRFGIRRLCAARLAEEGASGTSLEEFAGRMKAGPVAPVPEAANEQHYEAPAAFFVRALGPRLKYSSCHWAAGVKSLAEAEESALEETCLRAGLADGQNILELGCGWGSLTLWMAGKYPHSSITAVSNSRSQRDFIEQRAAALGVANLRVLTCDMNVFETDRRFNRIVSVEMFEHMRNYEELLRRAASWLDADGRLFVHIFCHRRFAYEFRTEGVTNWMGRHFFTGGIMPSMDLLERFSRHLAIERRWNWSGKHYEETANAWLRNMDANREAILEIFSQTYAPGSAAKWFQRWRIFFMACAELWGFAGGSEWIVGHYLLAPVHSAQRTDERQTAAPSAIAM